MNKIKRVRRSYVYRTPDFDAPWLRNTDTKVLFLFERRICTIDNVNFFPFVTAVSVFGEILILRYSRATMCGIAVFVPPLRPPPSSFVLILKKTSHTSFCFFETSKLVSPQFLLFTLFCLERKTEKNLTTNLNKFCLHAVAGFATHCTNRHGELHPRSKV